MGYLKKRRNIDYDFASEKKYLAKLRKIYHETFPPITFLAKEINIHYLTLRNIIENQNYIPKRGAMAKIVTYVNKFQNEK